MIEKREALADTNIPFSMDVAYALTHLPDEVRVEPGHMHGFPKTEEEKTLSKQRADKLSELAANPAFSPYRRDVMNIAKDMLFLGFLSEKDFMGVFSSYWKGLGHTDPISTPQWFKKKYIKK